ncbi:diguanylate cyclase domain-containing protein [Merismopedia glauca]|uniref:Serine/threonine-protein kinase PknK n=1 Tax=Merismopedia glauca CCAP 1448/3 TaxID=1296344 RepID=A0A2T1C6V7_9CYAN|nr:diguanylate cyclase [Merismopedia glauca]PSB03898.1 serine/threonine-protein kinase PknK [Merismopedia glauca CCAP 1448/3]
MIQLSDITTLDKIYESHNSLVYRGIRQENGQLVILKLLKEDYPTPAEINRYQQEYQILCGLNIEGVIKAYELQKYRNSMAIVFEDFGGESLDILLKKRQLSVAEFLKIAIQITDILGEIHQHNIIHKDINPSNIVFNEQTGQLKIIDFGISTILSADSPLLTNPDIVEGTLAYISPEQTGRMNRAIDHRTDFYSLGITFYELLTKQLPFQTDEPIEMLHSHVARQPVLLSQINPGIPRTISAIAMKLLAKNPESRYQNAYGIKADLQKCLTQLKNNGKVELFFLGENDVSDKFQITKKLYGRDTELKKMLAAFERVSQGNIELMLIYGYSGVGKSALVAEIYEAITQKNSYFISGKFDQLQRGIPYGAVVAAFKELVQQLLTETEDKLQKWRKQLLDALGTSGQVIINVIPEVELIIGKQPPVLDLAPNESQNRFKILFQKFIKVFCQPNQPLVIFLDDLHWTDSATLKLMQSIMQDPEAKFLFLMGAYRENEVTPVHPLMVSLSAIQEMGKPVNYIPIHPLNLTHVNQLIADTLKCKTYKTKPLAELVYTKTQGNPFFINEFLKSLYREKLVSFHALKSPFTNRIIELNWRWSLEKIHRQDITDNVVEFMAQKIKNLPKETQKLLHLAACIGNKFDFKTLAIINYNHHQDIAEHLRPAINEELIFCLSGKAALMEVRTHKSSTKEAYEKQNLKSLNPSQLSGKFIHDRIQQAAYSLIPETQKKALHLQIGKLLLQHIQSEELDEKIFDIINQINVGIELVTNPSEREKFAQLNLLAGQKAKISVAHESALVYLNTGIELLAPDCWKSQYNLTLKLHIEAVESAYINSDIDQMQLLAKVVLQQAKTVLDKIRVYQVIIKVHIGQNQPLEAVKTAILVLKSLDVYFPEQPSLEEIGLELHRTKQKLGARTVAELIDLPIMTAPEKLAAMQIISSTISATYFACPEMMPLFIFAQVNLSLKYGNTPLSAPAYAHYGLILCGIFDEIDYGYKFGELALNLLAQIESTEVKAKTFHVVNGFVKHFKEPIKKTINLSVEAYQIGLETGDIEYAAHGASMYALHAYFIGRELKTLDIEFTVYSQMMCQLKQEADRDFIEIYHQAILNLIGQTENPCCLVGTAYDEEKMLPIHHEVNNRSSIYIINLQKSILSYLFGEFKLAFEQITTAADYVSGGIGSLLSVQFYFYNSLIKLAVYSETEQREQDLLLAQVDENQQKIKLWADYAPANHLHKFYLVEAERCRVLKQELKAMNYYDRAITLAKENEYLNDEALAYELATKFYLAQGKDLIAQAYFQESYYGYLKWGATAKVADLKQKYAQLIATSVATDSQTTRKPLIKITDSHSSAALDLDTVLKASQAISSEIVLDSLLKKLMKIIIENAGARVGCLISRDGDRLFIEAVDAVSDRQSQLWNQTSVEVRSPVSSSSLPLTILNYVNRTHESVVLNNASDEGKFTRDEYILKYKPKSILCTPLIHQGKLTSIVYLENNLTTGTFTAERLAMVNLLCSQAAISLENARLYAEQAEYAHTLAEKVAERTSELEKANQELSRIASLDGLTQVANRRRFDEFLAQEWKRSQREQQTLSLILGDVDFFKLYNDYYGHQNGDNCLQQVAQAMKRAVKRPADLVARYGGEEFVVILPNTEAQGAIIVAQALQKEVQNLKILHAKSQVSDYVTLSLGVSSMIPSLDSSPPDLIGIADAALYEAKKQGRDRYIIGV